MRFYLIGIVRCAAHRNGGLAISATWRSAIIGLLTTTMLTASALIPFADHRFSSALAAGGGGGGAGGDSGVGAGANAGTHGANGQAHGKGSTASSLGGLNAAHASSVALGHAAPNSEIGMIAAYAAAINAYNSATTPAAQATALTAAATALANASNKGVTSATVDALNLLLGVSVSSTTVDSIAAQAAAIQGSQ